VQLICEQVPYRAMQTLPCLEFPYPHRLDDELPEQRRDARPMTRGKGHRAPWSTGDAARRAGRCCSCPSGDAGVRRLSTRSSTPPRCYPAAHRWPSRCRQRRSCYSRAAAIVADQHVQLGRDERAEHRRGLVLADLPEPGDRLISGVCEPTNRDKWRRATPPGGFSSIPACRYPAAARES
jgi:hypothetical protein